MDSGGAPQGIRLSHSSDKRSDLGADGRAATSGLAGERGPVQAEAVPLPAQDGIGRHDHEGRSPLRSHPGQADPEEPLAAAQPRPARRPLVHGELLAQGEVLEGELPVAAAEEWAESKQVEQRADHGGRLSPDQSRKINRLSAGRGFGEGQALLTKRGALNLALCPPRHSRRQPAAVAPSSPRQADGGKRRLMLPSLRYLDTFVKTDRVQLLLANVVDRLFGKGCLMEKVNRRHARISWNVFHAEVGNEIVPRRIRMICGYAAKARRQHVLHVKARIG